jgi:hypothetical protein
VVAGDSLPEGADDGVKCDISGIVLHPAGVCQHSLRQRCQQQQQRVGVQPLLS